MSSRATGNLDKDIVRRRYAEERAKRLRVDGPDQYLRLTGALESYLDDPHMPVTPREPVTDHVTFAFIGGGFAGLMVGARLKEAGIDDVRIVDKAGDFGGTWYWNRYPGAMCDSASLVYLPLLEETGYMPTEKYAHGPEIFAHCQRIGRQFDLYEKALFHTKVTSLVWEDDHSRWRIGTDRGDSFTAQFVGMGTGPLHVPKLPGIPGIEEFEGRSFHTSRWDYDYTGGDAAGSPLHKLADKRVAVIGTGATAIQAVPELSKWCKDLFVFQRTPSSVDVRNNGSIDPEWFATIASPGWQERWLESFASYANPREALSGISAASPLKDMVQDSWTDTGRRLRSVVGGIPPHERTPERVQAAYEDCDYAKMAEIRARVEAVVDDVETARKLQAWYRYFCKRPCFHDEYLQAFNRPNTHLVDTDGQGVGRITPRGVVACGREYEVDCIVYASGFVVSVDFKSLLGFDAVGSAGMSLSESWAKGMRTLHGMYAHGFPNLFAVWLAQGASQRSNVPHNYAEMSKAIAAVVRKAVDGGARRVEASAAGVDEWIEFLAANAQMASVDDCTPGYTNNEGREPDAAERMAYLTYPTGALDYFRFLDEWRRSGEFVGLEFG